MSDEVERVQITETGWALVEQVEEMLSLGSTLEEIGKVFDLGPKVLEIMLKIAEVSRDTLEQELRGE